MRSTAQLHLDAAHLDAAGFLALAGRQAAWRWRQPEAVGRERSAHRPHTFVRDDQPPALRDESQLLEHRHTVVKTELFDDQSVLDLQEGGAGKAHRLAGVRLGEPADRSVIGAPVRVPPPIHWPTT